MAEFFTTGGGIAPAKSDIKSKKAYVFASLSSIYKPYMTFDVADIDQVFLLGEMTPSVSVKVAGEETVDGVINSDIVASYSLEMSVTLINKIGGGWTLKKLQELMDNDLTLYVVEVQEAMALTGFISTVLANGETDLTNISDFCLAKYVLHQVSPKISVTGESSKIRNINLSVTKKGLESMDDGVYENVPFGVSPDQYDFELSSSIAAGQGYRATSLGALAGTTYSTDHYINNGSTSGLASSGATGDYYHNTTFSKYVYFEFDMTFDTASGDQQMVAHDTVSPSSGTIDFFWDDSANAFSFTFQIIGNNITLTSEVFTDTQLTSGRLKISVLLDLRRGYIYLHEATNNIYSSATFDKNSEVKPTDFNNLVFFTDSGQTIDHDGNVYQLAFGFI